MEDTISDLDRFRLTYLSVAEFERWLPTIGTAEAVYNIEGHVDVYLECAADLDLLLSIERVVIQQLHLLVGCEAVVLWFAGQKICVLRGI